MAREVLYRDGEDVTTLPVFDQAHGASCSCADCEPLDDDGDEGAAVWGALAVAWVGVVVGAWLGLQALRGLVWFAEWIAAR